MCQRDLLLCFMALYTSSAVLRGHYSANQTNRFHGQTVMLVAPEAKEPLARSFRGILGGALEERLVRLLTPKLRTLKTGGFLH